MVGSLKEFIILCDKKRANNINFSVKDEFNNLTKDKQLLIVSSINSIDNNLYKFASLPERMQGLVLRNYDPGYSEDIRKSKYNNLPMSSRITILTELMGLQDQDSFSDSKEEPFELSISAAQSKMIENLKITLSGIADIDEAQTTLGFPGKINEPLEGEVTTFIDVYSGVNVTVNNINGTCYIDNQEISIDQKEGYAEISYNDNSVRNKFLNELERLYFIGCAEEGLLSLDQMIDRGMILQVANSTNDKEYTLEQVFKLISVFEGQSSFLHFAIKKMSMQQLHNFIENIPLHLKKEYLNLDDRDGRKLVDLVANEPDKVQLIRSAIRERNNAAVIINSNQSAHIAAVHKTADESFVKLAKNSMGVLHQIDNDGETISLDHNKAKSFVNKNITNLQKRLHAMKRYKDIELFEYIKPSLDETQKNLNVDSPEIIKIIAFRRFQISKASELIDDAISKGNLKHKGYEVDVNIPNSNGLTVKEMIALCYNAISQTDKLLVGNKLDENGKVIVKKYIALESIQEQEDFLKITEFSFISGLYGIRRGYNIDENQDRPEEYEYTVNNDINVCPGGTVNRLAQSLSSLHEDIEVIAANSSILRLKFLKDVPRIINQIIEAIPENEKQILAFQLNEWKKSNKMPYALNSKIIEVLRVELSEENNEFREEFIRFFSKENIIRHCSEGLMLFSYPYGKIAEIDLDKIATIEGQINSADLGSLPEYTRDVQANHQLTIESITQKQPEFMINLLNDYSHKLQSPYVLRGGQLTPLVIDWSKTNGEMLLNEQKATNVLFGDFPELAQPLLNKFPELMFHLLQKNSSFRLIKKDTKTMILKDWLKNNGRMLIGKKEMEEAVKIVPDAFKDFLKNLSDEDFGRCAQNIYNAATQGCGNVGVIKAIPVSKQHLFINAFGSTLSMFVTNDNLEGVKALLDIGLDPDVQVKYVNEDEPSPTALYKASSSNRNESTEIVKMLIDAGADINIAKFNGNTAISVASKRREDAEKLKILKEYAHNPVDYLLKSHEDNPVGFISAIARVKKNGYNFEEHDSPDRFWNLDSEKITMFLNKEVANGATTNFRKIIKAGNQEMFEVALSFKPNITAKDKEMIGRFYPNFNIPNQELAKNKSWVDRIAESYTRKPGSEMNK